jgi:hypothetical protein
LIAPFLAKANRCTYGQGIEIRIENTVAVKVDLPIVRGGYYAVIFHGGKVGHFAAWRLLVDLDLSLESRGIFFKLTVSGMKGIAQGYVDIFVGVMSGVRIPVDFKLALRTGGVNAHLEEASLPVMLQRGFNNHTATDNVRMMPVHLVDPFPYIGL